MKRKQEIINALESAAVDGGFKLVGVISTFSMDRGVIYENSACRVDIVYDWIEGVIKNEGMVSE